MRGRIARIRTVKCIAIVVASLSFWLELAEPAAAGGTVTRGCESRVESARLRTTELPRFYRRNGVRIGPLVLVARRYAHEPAEAFADASGRPDHYVARKLHVLLRAGRAVTLTVRRSSRRRFSLLYDPPLWDRPHALGYRIEEGSSSVRFEACERDEPGLRGGTVGAWTQFDGSVLVAGPQCAAIAVREAARKPIRGGLAFGRASCPLRRTRVSTGGTGAGPDIALYGVGVSSDPYGSARPRAVGIARGILDGRVRTTEADVPDLGYGGPAWAGRDRIAVPSRPPPFAPPRLFAAAGLRALGAAPLAPLEPDAIWSPDGSLLASEPIALTDCGMGVEPGEACWRSGGTVFVARADGSERRELGRGHLLGWAPGNRVLVADERYYLRVEAVDPRTRRRRSVLPPEDVAQFVGRRAGISGKPAWSADGRYVAAHVGAAWPKRRGRRIGSAFLIGRADGEILRLVTSRFGISMLAWSPSGHRLAYTTSGAPDPHELFVLDDVDAVPRKLFATSGRHFDWVAWAPDGRHLLLDDANWTRTPGRPTATPLGRWLLVDATSGEIERALPRLWRQAALVLYPDVDDRPLSLGQAASLGSRREALRSARCARASSCATSAPSSRWRRS